MTSSYLLAGACALALPFAPVTAQDQSAHNSGDNPGHNHEHDSVGNPVIPPVSPDPVPSDPHAGHSPAGQGHAGHAHSSPVTGQPELAHAGTDLRYLEGCTSGALVIDNSHIDGIDCRPGAGSGTSRLPALDGGMHGLHLSPGNGWMVMLHGYSSLQYTNHSGPRGDDKTYVTTMAMLAGERRTGWGRIQLRTMMSVEPAMDARGYPNLFATGETANGEPLVDRQHPHDLFMELAARVDVNAGDGALFLYGGPVGEPAIGPSAFMHRASASFNPEPPITHHWFDSTHITYGVITAGYMARYWQAEISAFRGAEPDEQRWNIETPRLDSWSVRLTLNPADWLAMQLSHARIDEPERIHPGEDEARTTASIQLASHSGVSAMLAYSVKNRMPGDTLDAWLAEVNWTIDDHHVLFGRFENVANNELFPDHDDPRHEQRFRVSKFQAGYAWRQPLTENVSLALGGSVSAYAKPDALDDAYGRRPWGWTLFARLSVGM